MWERFKTIVSELSMQFRFGAAKEGYALAVLSSLPPIETTTLRPEGLNKPVVEIAVRDRGNEIYVASVHLKVHGGANPTGIRNLLSAAELQNRPQLLLGDFNALESGAPPTQHNPAPRVVIQAILDAGYSDCYRSCHRDREAEPGYTFSTAKPWLRYDYTFASKGFPLRLKSCRAVTEAGSASDHCPVVVDFE